MEGMEPKEWKTRWNGHTNEFHANAHVRPTNGTGLQPGYVIPAEARGDLFRKRGDKVRHVSGSRIGLKKAAATGVF